MKIGELFSGYGGLGLGVQAVYGGDIAWHSEIDRGACKILAHRYPDVPNLGDITTVDWSQVEPVDILTGGFPCQDVSAAGKRAGIRPGTRSGLWAQFAYAIAQLRPPMVVIENVRGLLSAEAHSDVEPCAWCVGDEPDGALRALGAVLGDLAGLGYDASWHGILAADVGAPHGRFRVFVVATDTQGDTGRIKHGDSGVATDANGRLDFTSGARADQRPVPRSDERGTPAALLPTPRTSDTNGAGAHGEGGIDLRTAVGLLPTPRATDGTKGGPNRRGSSGDLMLPSAVTLLPTIKAQRLLPTPEGSDGSGGRKSSELGGTRPSGAKRAITLATAVDHAEWGDYAAAIARWEHTLGRPAPAPTQTSSKGNPQLAPAFVEWMMGLPAGWVTDVPGITRNEALKALGNGVVPQQAAEALRVMASWEVAA